VIELALIHRLASLLWRLHRAIAIETGLFELQVEALPARRQDPSRGPRQPGTPPTQANGHSKVHVRDDPPIADHDNSLSTTMRPPLGPWSNSRTIVQCFLRLSNLDPTLLTAWAATKRDYGARQRKRFGRLRRCDSRRLQSGNDCATGSRPSPGIGRGRSRLTQSLGIECREDDIASAAVHWVNQG
jgi:hypothetical protein